MDAFAELERLSLVSAISSELQNHIGTSDKTLAEYAISQHKTAKSFEKFKASLDGFPDRLLESIDRLIKNMDPKNKEASQKNGKSKQNGTDKNNTFKGLSIPDKDPAFASGSLEDTMGALEAMARPQSPRQKKPGFHDRHERSPQRSRHRDEYNRRDYRRSNDRSGSDRYSKDEHRSRREPYSRHQKRQPSPSVVPVIDDGPRGQKRKKRMTSPERFELQQLIASGAASAAEIAAFNEDFNASVNEGIPMEQEEDIDIEVRDEEPPFLKGQTKEALELSPIRVVKAPDGSMARAAMSSEASLRERRDLKQQEARQKAEEQASKVDVNAQWNDPMIAPEHRRFAGDGQSARASGPLSEFKQKSQQKKEYGKRSDLSIPEQRRQLPVFALRQAFLTAVKNNQCLIVVGETGSGKTTQLPQYLAEDGYGTEGRIGITQPRRVAAVSVAKRVSEEVGCNLGGAVGYSIRFEDKTSDETAVKYMTDGILLREAVLDPNLSRYKVIMLDEAHERAIPTDIMFGLLKKIIKRRPDLKIIVTSATLDAERFSEYFNKAPIFSLPGRTYPVEIMYSREPSTDYNEDAITTALQIHLTEPPGDILLFLTGREEIENACEIIYERHKTLGPSVPDLLILPIYSALPSEAQSAVFDPAPPGSRKLIVATNIAETSLTIDGIIFVIDPGYSKVQLWDPKLGMDRLQVLPISQANAKQRSGRAGRTAPGKCFRLYTESAFQNEMTPSAVPDIQRAQLSSVILMMKAMGINDLLHFDFLDPPPVASLLASLEELYALEALDNEGLLTRVGRTMSDLPAEPGLSKTLVAGVQLNCSDEILTIAAMLSSQGEVWYRPRGPEQSKADQRKSRFHDPTGDHLTLLNVYNGWLRANCDIGWCRENYVQQRTLRRAKDIRTQLTDIMKRHKMRLVSCGSQTTPIIKALCAGFFRNSARKDPTEGYKTLAVEGGTPIYMHPSSALFGKAAEHVIYHGLIETTREYMHCVSTVQPQWLVEAAPAFFKVVPSNQLSKRKKQEKIQPLHNKFAGEDDWRLSAQRRQGRGGGGGTWG